MKYPIRSYIANKNEQDFIFIKIYVCDLCNYNCWYCYNKQPRKNNLIDLNIVLNYLSQIYNITNRSLFIELIGGEPTLHPQLKEFMHKLENIDYIKTIFLYSNFSQSIEYYVDACQLSKLDINFSWHRIYNDKLNKQFYYKAQKFLQFINNIKRDHCSFSVMYEPNNIINSLFIYKMLNKIHPHTDLLMVGQPKKINNIGRYQYSTIDYQTYKTILNNSIQPKEVNIVYNDGSIEQFSILEMMNKLDKNELSFYNWKCNAGIDRLYIHSDGNVYSCQQYYENSLNPIMNIYTDSYVKPYPIKCQCELCICESFVNKYIDY